jgi:hypothetical protein
MKAKRSKPLIMAAAQPTPKSPVMASNAQFFAHAPHSRHASRSITNAFFSFIVITFRGQTFAGDHKGRPYSNTDTME